MVYVLLADGFEEMEAVIPIDILRRAHLEVATVGVSGQTVHGAHGIAIQADILPEQAHMESAQMLILPGGMPGTLHLEQSAFVRQAVVQAVRQETYLAAICAAPSILGRMGLLRGKRATCFPGFEDDLEGAQVCSDAVVMDGKIITSRGAGTAAEFAFALVGLLCGEQAAADLRGTMQFQ